MFKGAFEEGCDLAQISLHSQEAGRADTMNKHVLHGPWARSCFSSHQPHLGSGLCEPKALVWEVVRHEDRVFILVLSYLVHSGMTLLTPSLNQSPDHPLTGSHTHAFLEMHTACFSCGQKVPGCDWRYTREEGGLDQHHHILISFATWPWVLSQRNQTEASLFPSLLGNRCKSEILMLELASDIPGCQ